jgi:hypothetical protein
MGGRGDARGERRGVRTRLHLQRRPEDMGGRASFEGARDNRRSHRKRRNGSRHHRP